MGIVKNIKCVLGKSVVLWLLPQEMEGDGIRFSTRFGLSAKGIASEAEYHHLVDEAKLAVDWESDFDFV
jgi:hypothetical protein